MDGVLQYFRMTYYTDPAVCLIAIAGIVVSFSIKKSGINGKHLNLFRLLFLGHIFSRLLNYYGWNEALTGPENPNLVKLCLHIDYLLTLLEYYAIASFLHKYVDKIILIISSIFFLTAAFLAYYFKFLNMQNPTSSLLYSSQAISILGLCFSYYKNIFKTRGELVLSREPSFWIATGCTFFMLSTLPISLFSDYFFYKDYRTHLFIYSIFHVFYILLFLMFIKAYLCQPATTK